MCSCKQVFVLLCNTTWRLTHYILRRRPIPTLFHSVSRCFGTSLLCMRAIPNEVAHEGYSHIRLFHHIAFCTSQDYVWPQKCLHFSWAATNPERFPPVRRAGLDRLQDSSPYVPVQGGVKVHMKEPRCGEEQICKRGIRVERLAPPVSSAKCTQPYRSPAKEAK